MECEREDSQFISVAPVLLFFIPAVSTCSISHGPFTTNADKSFTYTPEVGCSFSSHFYFASLASRSRISSL